MGKRRTCIRWLTRRLLETDEYWLASACLSYPQFMDSPPIRRIMQEIRDAGFQVHANFLTLISACAKAEDIITSSAEDLRAYSLRLEQAIRDRQRNDPSYICWRKYGF